MSLILLLDEYDYDQNNTTSLILNPDTFTCTPKPLGPKVALVLSFILIANFLLAVPGNIMVGLVISTSRVVLTSSDIYLFHLTVADWLMALTLPFFAVALVKGWLFGDFMCKFLSLIFEANFYTSILFLACISIDRYLVIVHSNEASRSHQRRCSRLLCAGVWALGLSLALPALFNDATKFNVNSEKFICSENFDIGSSTVWRLATRGFRHIFGFLIPLTVMIVCYSITIVRLMKTRGFQKHRAMRVIMSVVIAFLLCWIPYHITLMVDTLMRVKLVQFDCTLRRFASIALDVTNALAMLHSCINPFLYAFVGEKFRKKMMLLLQRKVRQERMSGFSRSTSSTSGATGTLL